MLFGNGLFVFTALLEALPDQCKMSWAVHVLFAESARRPEMEFRCQRESMIQRIYRY